MKVDLLAVVAAVQSQGEKEAKEARPILLQPLLGKSCLELAVSTLRTLGPAKTYLATNLSPDLLLSQEALKSVDIFSAGGWPQDLSFVFSLTSQLRRKKGRNLVIVDARFPLLQPRTLKSLFRRHRNRKNVLTILEAHPKAKFSTIAAIIANGEEVAEIASEREKRKRPRLLLFGLIRDLLKKGAQVETLTLAPDEGLLVDSPARAAIAIRVLRLRKIRQLENRGVVVLDPLSTWVDLGVGIGRNTVLYPAVVIEGNSRLGRECRVYPFVHLVNTRVGNRVKILSSTMIESSRIQDEAQVGPFTHFRPKTLIQPRAKVGNFVEMKNTVFGPGSKAGHLSYLGDCVVEGGVNIGAGTITCNYDGLRKHRTIIESGAFIGSGTELVAPVKIGRDAYIGAGSTITKDVSPEALAVARSRQVEKPGWAKRKMKKNIRGTSK